jgi:N-acetylglutamate synthase
MVSLWVSAGLEIKPNGRDAIDELKCQMGLSNTRFLGGFRDVKLHGVVIVSHDGRKGWINRLAVLPLSQRRGIARGLVASAEEWLVSEGINVFSALIYEGNTRSRELFASLDYKYMPEIEYYVKKLKEDF